MGPIDLVLCLMALVVGVAAQRVILWLEGNERFRRWRMARLPVARIADATPGRRVKLRGRVELVAEPLAAPLSGRRALGWILALEHVAGGRRRRAQLERAVDFRLRDDSGVALVRGVRAALVCALPAASPLGTPTPSLARLLDEAGVERRWLGTRWTPLAAEAVIAPEMALTVVGLARREGGTLIISAEESAPLYLSPVEPA